MGKNNQEDCYGEMGRGNSSNDYQRKPPISSDDLKTKNIKNKASVKQINLNLLKK